MTTYSLQPRTIKITLGETELATYYAEPSKQLAMLNRLRGTVQRHFPDYPISVSTAKTQPNLPVLAPDNITGTILKLLGDFLVEERYQANNPEPPKDLEGLSTATN